MNDRPSRRHFCFGAWLFCGGAGRRRDAKTRRRGDGVDEGQHDRDENAGLKMTAFFVGLQKKGGVKKCNVASSPTSTTAAAAAAHSSKNGGGIFCWYISVFKRLHYSTYALEKKGGVKKMVLGHRRAAAAAAVARAVVVIRQKVHTRRA